MTERAGMTEIVRAERGDDQAVATRREPLPPEARFERVTLPLPALLDTAAMILAIHGRDELARLEAAIRREHNLAIVMRPARLSARPNVYWSEQ